MKGEEGGGRGGGEEGGGRGGGEEGGGRGVEEEGGGREGGGRRLTLKKVPRAQTQVLNRQMNKQLRTQSKPEKGQYLPRQDTTDGPSQKDSQRYSVACTQHFWLALPLVIVPESLGT